MEEIGLYIEKIRSALWEAQELKRSAMSLWEDSAKHEVSLQAILSQLELDLTAPHQSQMQSQEVNIDVPRDED